MSVALEELAAFADGQLDEPRRAEVAAAVAADPALAAEVERHRALKNRLAAHFAPILADPLPERLTAPLGKADGSVVDFIAARQKRARPAIPRWGWIAGPALAASLALAVLLPRGAPQGYADARLASALDDQLVATQASNAPTRILLSFRDDAGQFCRAYARTSQSGIACKDESGWRLGAVTASAAPGQGDYKMAGSAAERIMAIAQNAAAGPALTASEEQAAKAKGWR